MIYRIRKENRKLSGEIHLSGSKSISNRVLIIEALMGKDIDKKNLSDSNDTKVLTQLLTTVETTIDAHDAGTVFRFLTAYLALNEGEWILTGSDRMKQRPIGDLVDPLRALGAQIEYIEKENFPPVKISGGRIRGGRVAVHSNISSQFASALLMIAPCLKNGLTLELKGEIVSQPYIEMTLSLMKHFGIDHTRNEQTIHIPHQQYHSNKIFIESDWSAASYYYEMAAFADEPELTLSGLLQNSFQGDSAIATLMESFRVMTTYKEEKILLTKSPSKNDFRFNLKDQPDLAPALFVTCAGLSQEATFTGLEHLQYKESHREEALQKELAKCGIAVTRSGDTIMIDGKFISRPYTFSTYLDHRMAMAFSPLAMLCSEIIIDDPLVVKKSYPQFWDHLQILGFDVEEIE